MSVSARPSWPVIGDGYQADLQVSNAHLWLFAEVYCLGYLAVVFDVNRKLKVAREDASDLEDAKKKAEGYAAGYLRYLGAGNLPEVQWGPNPRKSRRPTSPPQAP